MYKLDNRGFTLVELVVSIGIMGLLLFGVSALFPRGVQLIKRSESITIAANLVQAQIESILAESYEAVTTGAYEPRHTVAGPIDRKTDVIYINPTTLATASSDQGLKRVTVTVYYPTSYGEKTMAMSTFIAKK